jgi:hypothetical protein
VWGKYDEAEHLYRQVISMHEKVDGRMHPDFAALLGDLAFTLLKQVPLFVRFIIRAFCSIIVRVRLKLGLGPKEE